MDTIGGWFAGKAVDKEINSIGDSLSSMADETAKTVSNWFDSMMGKAQVPLPEFLAKFGLPKGLFPKNVSRYEFTPSEKDPGTGDLVVLCPDDMEVKFGDGTVLQYKKKLLATVKKGKLLNIGGLRLQGMMWTDITDVVIDKEKVILQARLKKTKPASLFNTPRDGVEVSHVK